MVRFISILISYFFSLLSKAVWDIFSCLAASRMLFETASVSLIIRISYSANFSLSDRAPGISRTGWQGSGLNVCPISWLNTMLLISICLPSQRMAARSTTFFSSRTLPGQSCRSSLSMPSGKMTWIGFPSLEASWNRKCSTKRGMSSLRSLKGGIWIGTTLIR